MFLQISIATYESLKFQFFVPIGSCIGLGQIMLPRTYSVRSHKPNMCFILPFQAFQFILFSSLVQVMLLSIIRTHSINGSITMMLMLAEAWAPPTGVPGGGVSGLVAPVGVLP